MKKSNHCSFVLEFVLDFLWILFTFRQIVDIDERRNIIVKTLFRDIINQGVNQRTIIDENLSKIDKIILLPVAAFKYQVTRKFQHFLQILLNCNLKIQKYIFTDRIYQKRTLNLKTTVNDPMTLSLQMGVGIIICKKYQALIFNSKRIVYYFYYLQKNKYTMQKGRGKDRRRNGNGDTDISKALSWILRHGAVSEGLSLQSNGYVPLQQVMQYLRKKGHKNISEQKIREIVDNNDKKRFQIEQKKHHVFIRATQGHTMKEVVTEELLTKITDAGLYPCVIHGTFTKFWQSIKSTGLNRMSRNHIHFAPGMPKEEGVVSGMRGSCDLIIQIDLQKAMNDGIQFFISSNNVILTQGVNGVLNPKYFFKILKKDGTLVQFNVQKQVKQIQKKVEQIKLQKKQQQQKMIEQQIKKQTSIAQQPDFQDL